MVRVECLYGFDWAKLAWRGWDRRKHKNLFELQKTKNTLSCFLSRTHQLMWPQKWVNLSRITSSIQSSIFECLCTTLKAQNSEQLSIQIFFQLQKTRTILTALYIAHSIKRSQNIKYQQIWIKNCKRQGAIRIPIFNWHRTIIRLES